MTVYKHYDQQQLNDQYNTRLRVPNYADYFEQWENSSRLTDKTYSFSQDVTYGNDPLECVDIFPANKLGSKTIIFIHGGYWHLLDKALFHFLAKPFIARDITTVFVNYPLAPSAAIDDIVNSCRHVIRWVHQHITEYNGDPSELYVIGHSAGGHLATMLLTIEGAEFIKGVVALSGLFNLEPIMHSYVNEVLSMNLDMALRNSPALLACRHPCPLLLITGSDESDEFQLQSLDLYNNWKSNNGQVQIITIPGRNHYSILDTLAEEGSTAQKALWALMQVNY